MIIGMCGAEFPDVRDFLARALPEAEIVIIDHGTAPDLKVDVLLPGGGNAVAVAEAAIFHLLALLRQFPRTQDSVRDRRVGEPIGQTLDGKTVTVLGRGAIGGRVMRLLRSFGADGIGIGTDGSLDEALARSDALVVAVPLTDQTRGMIGAAQFGALPPGGYLVNVGRGPVVDYAALLEALRSGRLAGAGLDVTWTEPVDPEDPLLAENVIVTPHIGGVTRESYAKMAAGFAASVRAVIG